MISVYQLTILFLLLLPGWVGATNISPDLKRLGQGKVYFMSFIKVYDASLYSSELADTQGILSGDVSKCLHLEYMVDIEKSDFVKAANAVLSRQFTQEQLAGISNDIDTLHQGYRDVQDGDTYTLCYNSADSITTLSYNGGVLVSIGSPGFSEVYFSIWLGQNQPLDETLRNDLLAGLMNN